MKSPARDPVPCWNQTHVHIFEGLHVGHLLCRIKEWKATLGYDSGSYVNGKILVNLL